VSHSHAKAASSSQRRSIMPLSGYSAVVNPDIETPGYKTGRMVSVCPHFIEP
jgi:hypothetical protein